MDKIDHLMDKRDFNFRHHCLTDKPQKIAESTKSIVTDFDQVVDFRYRKRNRQRVGDCAEGEAVLTFFCPQLSVPSAYNS